MNGSVKAKLIVFLIIALIAFSTSCVFASLTIDDTNDSYKLIQIKNDSFEPIYINKVPTIVPKNNNTTNITNGLNQSNYQNVIETYEYTGG